MNEKISAFLDGESDEVERALVVKSLRSDPGLAGTWERYHLIGSAMRRELDVVATPGLSRKIGDTLRGTEFAEQSRLFGSWPVRYAAGFAIAASVAAVAIFNLNVISGSPTNVASSKSIQAPLGKEHVARAGLPPEKQRVLNPYLVHHAEFSSALSVNAVGAYARVVGQERRPIDNNANE